MDPKHPKIKYVILDGERRWLCAQQIEKERAEQGLKDEAVPIPANIVTEPTTLQNILMMFHIHEVREPWELTPTALKLEVVMREGRLKDKLPSEIAGLTGLAPKRVKDCLTLLKFSKNYLDMSLRDKGERITGDFFVEMYPVLELIKEHYPKLYKKYTREGIIDRFVEKYEAGELRAVTEFRAFANLIRAQDVGASSSEKVVEALIATDESIQSTYKNEAEAYWKADKVRLRVDRLTRSLERLQLSDVNRRAPVFKSLRRLRSTLEKILESHA